MCKTVKCVVRVHSGYVVSKSVDGIILLLISCDIKNSMARDDEKSYELWQLVGYQLITGAYTSRNHVHVKHSRNPDFNGIQCSQVHVVRAAIFGRFVYRKKRAPENRNPIYTQSMKSLLINTIVQKGATLNSYFNWTEDWLMRWHKIPLAHSQERVATPLHRTSSSPSVTGERIPWP